MKSQFRQNKITGEWVIFAPSRRKRPMDFVHEEVRNDSAGYDPSCPFCPGNEHFLDKVLYEVRDRETGIWSSRAVYNKFPALTKEGQDCRSRKGIYLNSNGYGSHLVIIESPRHDIQLSNMTGKELLVVVEAYHHCYSMLADDPVILLVMLFKNFGRSAGASLYHPHSQIVGSCIVPKFVRSREQEQQRYFDEMGRCVMCDVLDFELEHKKRVVFENNSFVVFVPFAAEVPFEMWIVPRRHAADFNDINSVEKVDLAAGLEWVMTRIKNKLGNPDYNFAINSCTRYRSNEPQLHWFLRIVPRLTTSAGFEIGSGMCINPSLPESDAAFLRDTGPSVE